MSREVGHERALHSKRVRPVVRRPERLLGANLVLERGREILSQIASDGREADRIERTSDVGQDSAQCDQELVGRHAGELLNVGTRDDGARGYVEGFVNEIRILEEVGDRTEAAATAYRERIDCEPRKI